MGDSGETATCDSPHASLNISSDGDTITEHDGMPARHQLRISHRRPHSRWRVIVGVQSCREVAAHAERERDE